MKGSTRDSPVRGADYKSSACQESQEISIGSIVLCGPLYAFFDVI